MTRHRTLLAAAVSLAAAGAALAPAAPIEAKGGWAVTTVDAFSTPAADAPADITFTIRQHGVTLVDVTDVAIVVEPEAGAAERFAARGTGTVGHYAATVVFPEAGRVEWRVEQGWFGPQDLGVVDVGAAPTKQAVPAASATTAASASSEPRWPLAVRLLLPLGAAGLLVLAGMQLPRPGRRVEAA